MDASYRPIPVPRPVLPLLKALLLLALLPVGVGAALAQPHQLDLRGWVPAVDGLVLLEDPWGVRSSPPQVRHFWLTLRVDPKLAGSPLMLANPPLPVGYRLHANGVLLSAEAPAVAGDRWLRGARAPRLSGLTVPPDGVFDLMLELDAPHEGRPFPNGPWLLGVPVEVASTVYAYSRGAFLFLGFGLALGLLGLALYLARRPAREALAFGLLCLAVTAYMGLLVSGTAYPLLSARWSGGATRWLALAPLLIPLGAAWLVAELYPDPGRRAVRPLLGGVAGVGLLLALTAQPAALPWLALAVQIAGLLLAVQVLLTDRKGQGRGIGLCAFGLLSLHVTLLLPWWPGWESSRLVAATLVGALVSLLLFAGLLAGRLFRSLGAQEQYTAELEQILAARTAELTDRIGEAEAASRAKGHFLASVSHEIRTPMNAVLGYAQLLEREADPERRQAFLQAIRSGGRSLLTLIDDILDLARVEEGKLRLELVGFEPKVMIDEVLELLGGRAQRLGLSLQADGVDGLPAYLVGDPVRLRQILTNLVGNALKYTKEGWVHLDCRWRPDGDGRYGALVFEVTDSGIGISDKAKALLFQPFEQVRRPEAPAVEGVGLGLAISKGLVALMGGSLTLESREGEGSRFTVVIPNLAVESEIEAGDRDEQGIRFESARVLVGMGDGETRALLCAMLDRLGLLPIEAEDGEQALSRVHQMSPELLLWEIH